MIKNRLIALSLGIALFQIAGCGEPSASKSSLPKGVCEESSEWRDHNGPDKCSKAKPVKNWLAG